MLDITSYDADGAVVSRTQPSIAGGGPVDPRAICRGVTLPAGPTRRPRLNRDATVRDLCATSGLPLRAHRESDGALLLRYPGGVMVEADADGNVGGQIWGSATGPFPPRNLMTFSPGWPMQR